MASEKAELSMGRDLEGGTVYSAKFRERNSTENI